MISLVHHCCSISDDAACHLHKEYMDKYATVMDTQALNESEEEYNSPAVSNSQEGIFEQHSMMNSMMKKQQKFELMGYDKFSAMVSAFHNRSITDLNRGCWKHSINPFEFS